MPEIGRETLERPLLGRIIPTENRFRLETFRVLGLSEAPDLARYEEGEEVGTEEFHSLTGRYSEWRPVFP